MCSLARSFNQYQLHRGLGFKFSDATVVSLDGCLAYSIRSNGSPVDSIDAYSEDATLGL